MRRLAISQLLLFSLCRLASHAANLSFKRTSCQGMLGWGRGEDEKKSNEGLPLSDTPEGRSTHRFNCLGKSDKAPQTWRRGDDRFRRRCRCRSSIPPYRLTALLAGYLVQMERTHHHDTERKHRNHLDRLHRHLRRLKSLRLPIPPHVTSLAASSTLRSVLSATWPGQVAASSCTPSS